ncbi:hypothetical protein [Allokutzneria albata]|uniref:Alpha amylase inhibitor n=1 Tax=Allokutzneria albata TaxID=211114 RepID=A0A1G9XMN9_ALLAB|nr:hypothetical protein [Allokutzneria albata]SDM98028.1 hypothetical protein SAMN04489726_4301 [Allokutzneria albata]
MTSPMRRAVLTAAVVGAAAVAPVVTAGTALAAKAPSCIFITAEPVGWITQTYHLHSSCKSKTYKAFAVFSSAVGPCLTLKPGDDSRGFKIARTADFKRIELC